MKSLLLAAALGLIAAPSATLAQTAATAPARPLDEQVAAILAAAPAGTRWGFLVTTADGREVLAINPDQRFIPASNTKLFTTAAGYALLAEREKALVPGTPEDLHLGAGAIVGLWPRVDEAPDVILVGRGDARMSSAVDCKTDCLAVLADAVAAKVNSVSNVIGDDRWFPDQRWSPGMSWNNIGTDSGTAISALSVDDNEVPVTVTATSVLEEPKVEIGEYLQLKNDAVTMAGGKTSLIYQPEINANQVRLFGSIAKDSPAVKERLGVDDAAEHAAWQLKRLLEARGVKVSGEAIAVHRPLSIIDDAETRGDAELQPVIPSGMTILAGLTAPPLGEDIAIINKVSQNLHAELLLRRIARLNGSGSLADGRKALIDLFTAAGIPRAGYDFSDGSGMSSYNRVSPRAAVALLRWGAGQPWGRDWRASFPVGGIDGTLKRRFAGTPLQGRIQAKTGTLNATNALSGYLTAASGQELVISIFANDVPDGANAAPAMDAALLAIAAAN